MKRVEFEEWWGHPVTQMYMAQIKEEMEVAKNLDFITQYQTCEGVAMAAVANANRIDTLQDVSDKETVARALEVDDEV